MSCTHPVTGEATCHCARCHYYFTSPSAFDLHQHLTDGQVACSDPASLRKKDGSPRMEVKRRTREGFGVWGTTDSRERPWEALRAYSRA